MPNPFVLTFAQLKAEAEHAIGGTPDSRTDLGRLVNEAVAYLYSLHAWSWRQKLTTLSYDAATVSAGTINLPADFGEVVDLQPSTQHVSLRLAPMRFVVAARIHTALAGVSSFLWCLGMGSQATAAAVPLRTIELGPKPSAAAADALYLTYRVLPPVLVGDTDVPPLPYQFFPLLRCLCRAVAYSSTVAQAGHDWQLFNAQVLEFIAADTIADGTNKGQMQSVLEHDFGIDAVPSLAPGTQILMPGDP